MKRSFITSVFGIVSVLAPFGFGAIASAPAAPMPLEEVSFQVMRDVLDNTQFSQMDKEVFLSNFDMDSQSGLPANLIAQACLESVSHIENIREREEICTRFFESLFSVQNEYAERVNATMSAYLEDMEKIKPDGVKLAQTSDKKYYVANIKIPADLDYLSAPDRAKVQSQPAVFTKRDKFVCAFGDVNGQKLCKQESGSTEYFEYSGGMLSLKDKSSFGGDFRRDIPVGNYAIEPLTMEVLAGKRQGWSETAQAYVSAIGASETQGLTPEAIAELQRGQEKCVEEFQAKIKADTGMDVAPGKISVSNDCDLEKCWVDVSYLRMSKRCEYPLWGGIGYTEKEGHPSQIAKAEAEAQRKREEEQRLQREAEQRRQRQAEQRRQREAETQRQREAENERIRAERGRILQLHNFGEPGVLLNKEFEITDIDFDSKRFVCDRSSAGAIEVPNGGKLFIYAAHNVSAHLVVVGQRVNTARIPYVEGIQCQCIDRIASFDQFDCWSLDFPLLQGWNVPAKEVRGAEICCGGNCWTEGAANNPGSIYSVMNGLSCTARCPDGTQYDDVARACLPPLPDVEDELNPANSHSQ